MTDGCPALGIMCKAPRPGRAKTRLAATIGPERAAALSACFLRDVASAVAAVSPDYGGQGYGIYAPAGAEDEIRALLPASFELLLQEGSDLGVALRGAARHLLEVRGHGSVMLINSDSPTLPHSLLQDALAALAREGDRVVLGPATDGGYTLIGVKRDHPELFSGIPWSTPGVLGLTLEQARAIRLPAEVLPLWYDVDDLPTLRLLLGELAGRQPPFAHVGLRGGDAAATREFLQASDISA